jgi:DDE superfamily endonuclease
MNRLLKPLKKLPCTIEQFRTSLDKNKYDAINIYFQDESRFGLMTKQKRVLVSKGIKPVGKFQHSYKWLWLWGCFSPVTGDAFYWETPQVDNTIFEGFLNSFSQTSPRELKLIVIDNAGFHASQNITIPDNIRLIPF